MFLALCMRMTRQLRRLPGVSAAVSVLQPGQHACACMLPVAAAVRRRGQGCRLSEKEGGVQMDDPSISDGGKWSKERYDDIVSKLTPFLRSCGYNPAKDFVFSPIAALTGGNVLHKPAADVCDWWKGPTLFEALDSTEAPARDPMASFRMPIMDKYKDMGTVVMGKSESGVVQVRDPPPEPHRWFWNCPCSPPAPQNGLV